MKNVIKIITNTLCVVRVIGSRPSCPCPQRASCTQAHCPWQECPPHRCPPSTRACPVAQSQPRPPVSHLTSAPTNGGSPAWRRRTSEWRTGTATPTTTSTTKTTTVTTAATAKITSLTNPANRSHLTGHPASHASDLHPVPVHRPIRTPPEPSPSHRSLSQCSKAQDLSIKCDCYMERRVL